MTNRFYVEKIQFTVQGMVLDSPTLLKQLKQVLRVEVGEKIYLFDNTGMEYETQVTEIPPNRINIKLIKQYEGKQEPGVRVILYQSLLKKDKWEWLLQKVTELGVSEIIPMLTDHAVVDKLSENKKERYEKILIEATEQCGGCRVPILGELVNFKQAIEKIKKNNTKTFLLHTEGTDISLSKAADGLKEVTILVGPEGGFSDGEVSLTKENGIPIVQLGNRVLRSETAGMSAVGCLLLG